MFVVPGRQDRQWRLSNQNRRFWLTAGIVELAPRLILQRKRGSIPRRIVFVLSPNHFEDSRPGVLFRSLVSLNPLQPGPHLQQMLDSNRPSGIIRVLLPGWDVGIGRFLNRVEEFLADKDSKGSVNIGFAVNITPSASLEEKMETQRPTRETKTRISCSR